jgi:Leucine-rich repeat (LRR) protein
MGLSQLSSAPPSSSFYMRAFILFWWCGFLVTSVVGGNNETDQLALLEFKAKITHDPFGVMTSWNYSIHFCQWRGITCGRRHQRVTVLDLQSLKLVGSISPHVGNLSFLRNLTLQNNTFHNEIPPEIGRLRRLQVLRLDNNTISGKIPSNLSSCTKLQVLRFSYNLLTGEIPTMLGNLSKLRDFYIPKNNLTGSIPPSFGNLSFLEVFYVAYNNLGGIIPDSFGQLTKLSYFQVFGNRLSGTIPPSIFNLSFLEKFDVGVNQIQGRLPSDIGITLPNIKAFSIFNNQFIGSIPVSISNASNLYALQLNGNNLSGKVPSLEKLNRMIFFRISFNNLGNGGENDLSFLCSLTNASYLTSLVINVNNFGGELPKCVANFSTTLRDLLLDNNKIFGNIPNGIGNLINLQRLTMWQNKLSGNIPFEIGKLQKLQYLALNTNDFYGNIPSSIGNLTALIDLYLYENNFQGNILSLSKCQNLIILNLENNNLSGLISSQIIGLSCSPILLYLSANQFTGVLPMEIGNFINLQELDVSENMLFGKIPTSLGSCVKLENLDMGKNHLEGIIPPSLESLRGLQYLDLSDNNLSGQIPKFLEQFVFLQFLNLSYNHFEGEVPTERVFKNTSGALIMGNGKLCGGIPKFHLPKCKYEKSKKRKLTLTLKLIISIFFGLLGVTLVFSILLLFSLRKKRKENTSSDSGNLLLNLSYQSLLNATQGFSSTNLIGVGSFGSVYKGILDQGRHTIAIKVLNLSRHGASKSFKAECEALRNIRHRNLVKVLTSCSGIDYQGHDFKALVMEFMGNGSLDEWLHLTPRKNETLEEQRSLSLLQRLNIAIDVANALDYLHHQCHTPIVHCDLKPSNVLLDDEMIGHVGDFGLARFLFYATQDSSINQSSSIGVRGTVGYTPPGEYYYYFLKFNCFPLPIVLYYTLKLERTLLTSMYYN